MHNTSSHKIQHGGDRHLEFLLKALSFASFTISMQSKIGILHVPEAEICRILP